MNIGKKDVEGFGPVTVQKNFTYREYPVETSKAAGADYLHWVVYAREGFRSRIIAEGPAESSDVAMARVRSIIDAERARLDGAKALDDADSMPF